MPISLTSPGGWWCAPSNRSPKLLHPMGRQSTRAPPRSRIMTGALYPRMSSTFVPAMAERLAVLDWQCIATNLDADGYAVMSSVLSPEGCESLAATYAADGRFRSRIVMARHGFGRGEYKYFAHPLPDVVASLRSALYPPLARI